jgi:diketogulonate reductase-like aldo/keto reductase
MECVAGKQRICVRTKELDQTGVWIPEIELGTYRYKGGPDLLRKGVEQGAFLIDTAELYQNEEVVGHAIKGLRDRVLVATKTHHARYKEVLHCAEASLQRLGIETIDLYQLHWHDAAVPIEETMAAMEELVDRGKVRFIGVSNFTVREMRQAQSAMRKQRIVSNQVRYSLVDRSIEVDLLRYCQENRVTVIAYSPLAQSFQRILDSDRDNALEQVAWMAGKTKAQVALNWCISKPGVVAIPKTESLDHLVENCGASDWRLTNDQLAMLARGIRFRCRSRLETALRRFARRTLQRVRG